MTATMNIQKSKAQADDTIICPHTQLTAETFGEIQSALIRRTWQLVPTGLSKEERNGFFGVAREQAAFEFAADLKMITVEDFESQMAKLRNAAGASKQKDKGKPNGNGNGHHRPAQPALIPMPPAGSIIGDVQIVGEGQRAPEVVKQPSLHALLQQKLTRIPAGSVAVIPFVDEDTALRAQKMIKSAAEGAGWPRMEDGSTAYMTKIIRNRIWVARLQ